MARALTRRQRAFVDEFLVDLNATRAAKRAGYTARTACKGSWLILKSPLVRAAVDAALEARTRRVAVSADQVIAELAKIAFADLRSAAAWREGAGEKRAVGLTLKPSDELDEATAAAISEVSQTTTGAVRLKLHDKHAALVTLGRHLGLFGERGEAAKIPGRVSAEPVDAEEAEAAWLREVSFRFRNECSAPVGAFGRRRFLLLALEALVGE